MVDEAHERSLQTDILMGILKLIQVRMRIGCLGVGSCALLLDFVLWLFAFVLWAANHSSWLLFFYRKDEGVIFAW